MDCNYLLTLLRDQLLQRLTVNRLGETCRVELPLLEPNGDAISVYIEEVGDKLRVHDGGHIYGLLFEVGPAGASPHDKRYIDKLAKESGLGVNSERGIIYVEAYPYSLMYWIFELGRVVSLIAATVPTTRPGRRSSRKLGPRTVEQIIKKLMAEGFMGYITPGRSVRGVTEQERYVDLSYTIPRNPLLSQPDTTVFILALDLDVADPIGKARNGLITATELGGAALGGNEIDLRLVHSAGDANGQVEKARKLIRVAAEKHLLTDYSWDDPGDQGRFITTVEQELSSLART